MITIDILYNDLIKVLSEQGKIKDVSLKILKIDNNENKVIYIRDLMNDYEYLPKNLLVAKSASKSVEYREKGNECFKNLQYYESWQYYNLSLMNAPPESENIPLAYSNRSAVFNALKFYDACITDIETVFSMKYPVKLKDKLLKRKKLCIALRTKGENNKFENFNEKALQYLNMSSKRSPRYLAASDKLKVMYTKEMGRHVIAVEDLNVGEVLAIEKPYFGILVNDKLALHCTYCLSISKNLIPCQNCCFALYCSESCKKMAFIEYHKIECSLMATLIKMDFTKLELLALRTVIKARYDHKSWDDLITTINEAEKQKNTEFRGHVNVNEKWIYDSKFYASIHMLDSNVDKRSISDIFQKAVTAAAFLHLLQNSTDFFSDVPQKNKDKITRTVAGLLLHHIMTTPINMHSIDCVLADEDNNYILQHEIGSAPYAFHSLINHSCSPNVCRTNNFGTITLICLRPIKKGMQLFDNYGSLHATETRIERQEKLRFQYKFNCCCEACVYDWPLYLHMRPTNNLPQRLKDKFHKTLNLATIKQLKLGNLDVAIDKYRPLCELAQELEAFAPCIEQADCQESLKQCLALMITTLANGYSKLVKIEVVPDGINDVELAKNVQNIDLSE